MNAEELVSPDARSRLAAWLESVALVAVCGVIVARFVTVTESAPAGGTLWIAQLSFLALLFWTLARYAAGSLTLRAGWLDAAAGLLVVGHVLGGLWVFVQGGDQRTALNLLWEWLGVGTTAFLMLQMTRSGMLRHTARGAIVACILATTASLAGLGVWQHHIGYPELAAQYRQWDAEWQRLDKVKRPSDPQWSKRVNQLQYLFASNNIPVDANSRKAWEQRVLHSSEPYGLFSLANTFAGLLAPALILLLGWLRGGWRQRFSAGWILAMVAGVLIAYCLVLTKSRTAWVGAAAGFGVWGTLGLVRRRRRIGFQPVPDGQVGNLPCSPFVKGERSALRWVVAFGAGLLIVVGLVTVAVRTGGLDRLVLSESGKSLRYRLEWWESTWRMLREDPRRMLTGVGLGNFRQHYLKHKLPQSSEEIADPHNFVLDVWSNGGILGLAGILGIVIGSLASAANGCQWNPRSASIQQVGMSERIPECADFGRRLWQEPALWGVLLGIGWVVLLEGEEDARLWWVWIGSLATTAAFSAWTRRIELDQAAVAGAFVALMVHLLGAGGMGMPAMLQLVLGLAILTERPSRPEKPGSNGDGEAAWLWRVAIVGLTGIGLFAGGWWNLRSVLSCTMQLADGDRELYLNRQPRLADRIYARAAEADPLSPEPWRRRAIAAFGRWRGGLASEFEEAVRFQKLALERDPFHHGTVRGLGEMYRRRFEQTHTIGDAQLAADWFQRAIDQYPHHAALQADLAEAAWGSNDRERSRAAARRAAELHEINVAAGHPDKQLSSEQLSRMQELAGPE